MNLEQHFFNCPYCWEKISVLLDTSVLEQDYIEDCEICCNPIRFRVKFDDQELVVFEAEREQ